MSKLFFIIIIIILFSWFISYLVNKFSKNSFWKYILPIIPFSCIIFYLIKTFKTNEVGNLFGLFLSLI